MISIIDLHGADPALHEQAAELLVEGFRDMWPDAWPDIQSARHEVAQALASERIALAAVENHGVAGWVGGIETYEGNVWELHPLVVRAGLRGRGIGSSLVRALEQEVAARGALTLWVGSDDETGQTSLYGADLYPDPLVHLQAISDLGGHPFTFYRRLGFAVTGVVPDANGFGKPDILLSKRVGRI
jgi:aminoglycoside 6'-N-acetyltransferase I